MNIFKVNACQENGRELICEFLEKLEVKFVKPTILPNAIFNHNRYIKFEVNGQEYHIEWYINQCTLIIGNREMGARIPFKWMYQDVNFPIAVGNSNRSIGFSDEIKEKQHDFDDEFPYAVLRIPTNRI
jgi:hypothetical protein